MVLGQLINPKQEGEVSSMNRHRGTPPSGCQGRLLGIPEGSACTGGEDTSSLGSRRWGFIHLPSEG